MCDTGGIEIVAHGNPLSTWAFLINHGGEQLIGERGWARTIAPLPQRAVEVTIRYPQGRLPDTVTVQSEAVPWEQKDGAVMIPVALDLAWSVIRVDWQYALHARTTKRRRSPGMGSGKRET